MYVYVKRKIERMIAITSHRGKMRLFEVSDEQNSLNIQGHSGAVNVIKRRSPLT